VVAAAFFSATVICRATSAAAQAARLTLGWQQPATGHTGLAAANNGELSCFLARFQ